MIIWHGQEAYLHVDPGTYLARCQRQWAQENYYPAVRYAVLFCTYNNLRLPDWLMDVVNEAMLIAFEHGGRTTNRRKGGYRAQARQLEKHRQRWAAVTVWKLAAGVTNDQAFERASESLKGTEAQGQPRQQEESYRKVRAMHLGRCG